MEIDIVKEKEFLHYNRYRYWHNIQFKIKLNHSKNVPIIFGNCAQTSVLIVKLNKFHYTINYNTTNNFIILQSNIKTD